MAYSEQTWSAGRGGNTPVNVTRLQHMEDGIAAAAVTADLGTPGTPTGDAARAAFGLSVVATVSASATLAVGKFTPVDATGGARTMTLPTGAADGVTIGAEKVDSSTNAVSVTGNIRGVPATTITLPWQHETLLLRADSTGSWWPVAGHKTKASLDAAYVAVDRAAIDIRDHGGKCDGQVSYYGQATSGSATLTDLTAAFTSALVGRTFTMLSVTGVVWTGTITAVPSATTLTISTAAPFNSQVATGTTGAMTAGNPKLTDNSATFDASWVGGIVTVQGAGAGGVSQVGQVVSVTDTHNLFLCQPTNQSALWNASTTVTGATWTINQGWYTIGSDDLAAWNTALTLAANGPVKRITWTGTSMVSDTVVVPGGVTLVGQAMAPCSPALTMPTNGSVLRPHGSFPNTAGKGLVQFGTGGGGTGYLETQLGPGAQDCTFDARRIADRAFVNKSNLPRLRGVQMMCGRTGAVLLQGWQTQFDACIASQYNRGECVTVQENDVQWRGGFIRNYEVGLRLTNIQDFTMSGSHFFNGYGHSNTYTGVSAIVDTTSGGVSQNCNFDGVQFDDVLGPHVKVVPAAGTTISDLSFGNCVFYQYGSQFISFPGNVYPIMQLDTSAGAGATISRVSWSGGTVFNPSSALAKSLIDCVPGAGVISTLLMTGVMATFVTTAISGTQPTRAIIDGIALFTGNWYYTPNGANATATGNGAQTSFTIPHGVPGTPKKWSITPANATTPQPTYVTADATNLTVVYATAPANAAALSWTWQAAL